MICCCRYLLLRRTIVLLESGKRKAETPSAIIPVLIGDETKAVAASAVLREQGHFCSGNPLSDRGSRPGALARDPDRDAHRLKKSICSLPR